MDRTRHENADFIPVFLSKAGSLSERAARAMTPNGGNRGLASRNVCNVITLRNADEMRASGFAHGPGTLEMRRAATPDSASGQQNRMQGGADER